MSFRFYFFVIKWNKWDPIIKHVTRLEKIWQKYCNQCLDIVDMCYLPKTVMFILHWNILALCSKLIESKYTVRSKPYDINILGLHREHVYYIHIHLDERKAAT